MPKRKETNNDPDNQAPGASRFGPAVVKREVTRSPSFVSVYANDVQFQATPWDLRLVFGQIEETPTVQDPTMKISLLVDLKISPQLAKKLVQVMIEQIRTYEQNFGEIPSSNM